MRTGRLEPGTFVERRLGQVNLGYMQFLFIIYLFNFFSFFIFLCFLNKLCLLHYNTGRC